MSYTLSPSLPKTNMKSKGSRIVAGLKFVLNLVLVVQSEGP